MGDVATTSFQAVTISEDMLRNRRRSAGLLAGFVGLVVLAAALLSVVLGLGVAPVVAALVLAGLASGAAYLYSDRVALNLSHARPVSPEEEPRYHNLVEGLCIAAGLPKPELYVIEDAAANAFATGRNPHHAALVVTRGLLDKLSRVELEGVLAHELSHIRRGDILVTTLAVTLVGLLLPLPALSTRLIGLTASRRRESEADLSGVRLTRYPPGLIAALEKLKEDTTVVHSASRATAHLWIESPLPQADADSRGRGDSSWLNKLFDTHPPLEERIQALKEL
jgi:heat shock protein HtpX